MWMAKFGDLMIRQTGLVGKNSFLTLRLSSFLRHEIKARAWSLSSQRTRAQNFLALSISTTVAAAVVIVEQLERFFPTIAKKTKQKLVEIKLFKKFPTYHHWMKTANDYFFGFHESKKNFGLNFFFLAEARHLLKFLTDAGKDIFQTFLVWFKKSHDIFFSPNEIVVRVFDSASLSLLWIGATFWLIRLGFIVN